MRSRRTETIVRWLAAGGIAAGGLALTVTNSHATQRYFSSIAATDYHCYADANGDLYNTDAWAFKSNGLVACNVGGSILPSYYGNSGDGSTAETLCSDPNSGSNWAVNHMVSVAGFVNSTGGMDSLCWSNMTPFTQTASCSISAATVNGCPSGATIQGQAWGINY